MPTCPRTQGHAATAPQFVGECGPPFFAPLFLPPRLFRNSEKRRFASPLPRSETDRGYGRGGRPLSSLHALPIFGIGLLIRTERSLPKVERPRPSQCVIWDGEQCQFSVLDFINGRRARFINHLETLCFSRGYDLTLAYDRLCLTNNRRFCSAWPY